MAAIFLGLIVLKLVIPALRILIMNIEAETKWLPFLRQRFQMQFFLDDNV